MKKKKKWSRVKDAMLFSVAKILGMVGVVGQSVAVVYLPLRTIVSSHTSANEVDGKRKCILSFYLSADIFGCERLRKPLC